MQNGAKLSENIFANAFRKLLLEAIYFSTSAGNAFFCLTIPLQHEIKSIQFCFVNTKLLIIP